MSVLLQDIKAAAHLNEGQCVSRMRASVCLELRPACALHEGQCFLHLGRCVFCPRASVCLARIHQGQVRVY